MTDYRKRAERFREVNGWPWCGECELDDSCHGCEVGLQDLATVFAEAEAEALERAVKRLHRVHLGRLWCPRCESYDHECGCDPSIVRKRQLELYDAIRALKEKKP